MQDCVRKFRIIFVEPPGQPAFWGWLQYKSLDRAIWTRIKLGKQVYEGKYCRVIVSRLMDYCQTSKTSKRTNTLPTLSLVHKDRMSDG